MGQPTRNAGPHSVVQSLTHKEAAREEFSFEVPDLPSLRSKAKELKAVTGRGEPD